MKMQLIDYTGIGNPNKRFAAELLAFTKSTRLQMTPDLMSEINKWPDEKLESELKYMAGTIPSSWEFVNYTFLITECTRAFTHQLVRNRHGSYAQQTMRILDVNGFGYETGPSISSDLSASMKYEKAMDEIDSVYSSLVSDGAAIEDARGILPTNIHTNIIAKFNLRTLAEIVSKRSSPRTQGEYRQYVELLGDAVIEVHPWAGSFLRNKKTDAAAKLDDFISEMFDQIIDTSSAGSQMDVMKLVDILRG